MITYILRICVLLLFFYTIIKCSENEGDGNVMRSSSAEGSSTGEGSSAGKRRKVYVNYNGVQPHSPEETAELKALLTEKETILKIKSIHNWEDIHKYPLEKHYKYWNTLCESLWPGIPKYIKEKKLKNIQPFCLASHFPMPGSGGVKGIKYIRGFPHDYDPDIHVDMLPFFGDFICCSCKYVKVHGAIQTAKLTARYFFAMKIGEREYFLLRKVHILDTMDEKVKAYTGTLAKIVDYVNLPESRDINLNI